MRRRSASPSVHLHRHRQRRDAVPHPVLGRCRDRPAAEKRLVRPQHDEQGARIHVLRPADRRRRADRGARLGRRRGALCRARATRMAMAEGIAALLDDPGRRREMGAFGQERLRNALAFEYSVPNLLAAYDAAWARVRRSWLRGGGRLRPNPLICLADFRLIERRRDRWRRISRKVGSDALRSCADADIGWGARCTSAFTGCSASPSR